MTKRMSPLKLKKDGMAEYAKQRQKTMKKPRQALPIVEARSLMMHDPEGDLHHLMRAAEVKADKKRHKAAQDVGRKRLGEMQRVLGADLKE